MHLSISGSFQRRNEDVVRVWRGSVNQGVVKFQERTQ